MAAAASPHLALEGGLPATSDALIGHSPRGRPRRRDTTLARGNCRETGVQCGHCRNKSKRINNKEIPRTVIVLVLVSAQ